MTDQARLARNEANPPLLRLHRALSRLTSVLTVMNTGAHPDDEQSGMLAWLRYGQGMRIVIACSTRGEGGQNILGPERGGLLGILRTREMEEAARVLDSDIAWLGHGPDDPVHDFGFSKDGDQTLARWGEARVISRLAEAYRRWRPDVVIPTFLDVPGQHGHHRAMTRAAESAIALAAQSVPEQSPWQVSRFYLPAWSGAGGTYDDTEPPPPATLRLAPQGFDAATGASFAEIGEWSRRRHASQGMGHWPKTPDRGWPLHWKGGRDEAVLAEGLPRDLDELARLAGPAKDALSEAGGAVGAAIAAFPDKAACLNALRHAGKALDAAQLSATREFLVLHGHRLSRKRREIDAALVEAVGLDIWASGPARLSPGAKAEIHVSASGPALTIGIRAILPDGLTAPTTEVETGGAILPVSAAADTADSLLFQPEWDAIGGNGPCAVEVSTVIEGLPVLVRRDLETPMAIRPEAGQKLHPDAVLITGTPAPINFDWQGESLSLNLPTGWRQDRLTLIPPVDLAEGLTQITAMQGGRPALAEASGSYPHIGAFTMARPAVLRVLRLNLALPQGARIAYLRGTDDCGPWLERMGLDVTLLHDVQPGEDFAAFTTVLAGVVAFGARPDLAAATPALHQFVQAGGHLVTFYQRPDQGWNPAKTPPRRLTIGTPSLRWRVTDPAAEVTILDPDHPLFSGPNLIGQQDFNGWHKERGLYFASDWDSAYQPLITLADPGEAPLSGALLSGRIGRGRHTHCALTLHHQLEQMVPGAFRLMANLMQPA